MNEVKKARGLKLGSLTQLQLMLLAFLASGASFCLVETGIIRFQPVSAILAIVGAGTCGVSWIFARALFRGGTAKMGWPLILLALLHLSFAARLIADEISGMLGGAAMLASIAGNLYAFAGTVTLALGFVEIFVGFDRRITVGERVFRLAYAGGYGLLVFVTAILLQGGEALFAAGPGASGTVVICCLAGMGFATLAAVYRQSNSLANARLPEKKAPAHPQAKLAANKVRHLLETEPVYTDPDLSVSRLAQLVGEPKHRISQGITSELGFANFNQMINHHRAQMAAKLLASPEQDHLPILTIALDCGFSSMGPFNRVFKEEFGMTPSQYRTSNRAQNS